MHNASHNDTPGGADCGVAIIIVVDVRMDLGDGGGGAGHEQGRYVSEPHDARCVAVECVWLRVCGETWSLFDGGYSANVAV